MNSRLRPWFGALCRSGIGESVKRGSFQFHQSRWFLFMNERGFSAAPVPRALAMVRRVSSNLLIYWNDTGAARRDNRRGANELQGRDPRQILTEDDYTFTVILPAMFIK